MKKLIYTICALALILALAGCGNDTPPSSGVDVDLSSMSSTLVFSTVNQMMQTPDDFRGKTVRMTGAFSVFQDSGTGKLYFSCVIPDATGCCSSGLEFVVKDGSALYPNDYPKAGETVTVTGTFSTYHEGNYEYITLLDATMS